jgi:hypothetical protein
MKSLYDTKINSNLALKVRNLLLGYGIPITEVAYNRNEALKITNVHKNCLRLTQRGGTETDTGHGWGCSYTATLEHVGHHSALANTSSGT